MNEEKKKVISVYLPIHLVEKLRKHIKNTCGNLSWWLGKTIIEAIEREQKNGDS